MNIKPILLSTQLRQLKRELFMAQQERGKHIGKRMSIIVESLLLQTTRYWNESGENKYPKPVPKIERKVKVNFTNGVLKLEVIITMIDSRSGKPHFIWHILSQGRREYNFPAGKKSPPIRERKKRRTKKRTLQVQPFQGFTGDTFVIHGGQRVRGVEGNEWYELAAEEAMKIFQNDDEIKHWVPTFKIHPMKRGS